MILRAEKKDSLRPTGKLKEQHWHPLLLGMLDASFAEFGGNDLAFITYNYDRSLEEFLYTSFKSRESKDHSEAEWAARLRECIPIVHLHGQVGQHEAFASDQANVVRYGGSWLADTIKTASQAIRIVHEVEIQPRNSQGRIIYDPEFAKAWLHLKNAEVICFLGFGFHPLNIKRLHLEGWKALKIGTAYGMTDAEKSRVERASEGNIIPENLLAQDCRQFIRESDAIHKVWTD